MFLAALVLVLIMYLLGLVVLRGTGGPIDVFLIVGVALLIVFLVYKAGTIHRGS